MTASTPADARPASAAGPVAEEEYVLETPHGEGRLVLRRPETDPLAVLLLSHGAGGGIEAPDLAALARDLPAQGVAVGLFEQPWRRAGRRLATAPKTLDAALVVAAGRVREEFPDVPLVLGGRSAGARSACRSALVVGASGVLALAFPLHPPGRPERSRLEELTTAGVPTLVLQGERDTFGRPEEFPDDVELGVVPGGDHSFAVLKRGDVTADDALAVIVESTLEWVVRQGAGTTEEEARLC